MTGAIVITWGQGVAGREDKGFEVFGNALGYFEDLAKKGRIHSHREYFALTGRDGGMMIVDGEIAELAKIITEDPTIRLNTEAGAIVKDFEMTLMAGGSDATVGEMVGRFRETMKGLGYMK